ncbi:two-component system response regulator [Desulfuribacillus stibiiarsenatis]|uniref:Two-component system response regulator n=1 Tax=Desulfuribacillus stibiiarsenatis TaxID=1390249 RepID=A0A1E5L4G9_9FIRM|nr:response regulator [Desulfuribacillus stibiiarsenatis]OEH84953.1 two-component system response regulator [Desulfuribacillus stibiiarsenatis]
MKKSVLVVDDTTFIRKVMREIVEENGFEVVDEATNGIEALDMYQQYKPDLVIMDITMPHMDGFEAIEKIREMDQHAKVIMCSVLGAKEAVTRCMKAGALDFIVKPIKKERVVAAIAKVFG